MGSFGGPEVRGIKDTLAERLRRRPAKPMGSPRVGSNPTGVDLLQCRNRRPSGDCQQRSGKHICIGLAEPFCRTVAPPPFPPKDLRGHVVRTCQPIVSSATRSAACGSAWRPPIPSPLRPLPPGVHQGGVAKSDLQRAGLHGAHLSHGAETCKHNIEISRRPNSHEQNPMETIQFLQKSDFAMDHGARTLNFRRLYLHRITSTVIS